MGADPPHRVPSTPSSARRRTAARRWSAAAVCPRVRWLVRTFHCSGKPPPPFFVTQLRPESLGVPSDVLQRLDTAGGAPPPPPPSLPFQCLRLTAKILLRRLWCQEDLRLKISGPPLAGTIGGPWEEGGGQPNPLPPPPLQTAPLLRHPLRGLRG